MSVSEREWSLWVDGDDDNNGGVRRGLQEGRKGEGARGEEVNGLSARLGHLAGTIRDDVTVPPLTRIRTKAGSSSPHLE